jgi:hypothetical protein
LSRCSIEPVTVDSCACRRRFDEAAVDSDVFIDETCSRSSWMRRLWPRSLHIQVGQSVA